MAAADVSLKEVPRRGARSETEQVRVDMVGDRRTVDIRNL